MNKIIDSPLFGIFLCIITYQIGILANRKLKLAVANPLMIAIVLCVAFLQIFHIPLEKFQNGGNMVNMLLGPVTAVLAITIYNQFDVLKRNFLPIFAGCLVGSITSMVSAYLLSNLFGLEENMISSMIPKSVTTPIAMGVAESLGGIVPITVAAVVFTGILGAIFAPVFIRIFRVKNSVAAGVAIGTSSHALGTTKAIQIGEVEGAMSGLAIGISGIITVLLSLVL